MVFLSRPLPVGCGFCGDGDTGDGLGVGPAMTLTCQCLFGDSDCSGWGCIELSCCGLLFSSLLNLIQRVSEADFHLVKSCRITPHHHETWITPHHHETWITPHHHETWITPHHHETLITPHHHETWITPHHHETWIQNSC